ncbi:ABC transporter permease [Bosea sp. 124]|uniref:ABC transporter permease n=1 Tax=Bosea sp. 124 TaxID=2135642 RepID=UPI000D38F563|nr:ABC transporter permease [Bosea sp. 124]PTM40067.1 ABC-type dipeptide/oligopeptide/nickel transport system permease subunit [Bosea sp. 124]
MAVQASAGESGRGRAPSRRRHRPVGLVLACTVVLLVAAASLAAPWLTGNSPLDQDLLQINKGPSADFPLGTDHLGRDVFARLLYGARSTLGISVTGTAIAFAIGAGLGLLALSFGRWPAAILFSAIDLVRALPGTLLALLLIVGLGSGAGPLILALGISFAPLVAYVTRATYLREQARDYVQAASSFCGGRLHILRRHILPNIAGALVTQAAIILPRCIVTESVLSFLGVGSSPDAPTWGRMIADSSRFVERAPHAILVPLLALVLLTLSLSAIGNHLRRHLDPVRGEADGPAAEDEPEPVAPSRAPLAIT